MYRLSSRVGFLNGTGATQAKSVEEADASLYRGESDSFLYRGDILLLNTEEIMSLLRIKKEERDSFTRLVFPWEIQAPGPKCTRGPS